MRETHLAVATTLTGIPQTKTGSPIPGKFDVKDSHTSGADLHIRNTVVHRWERVQYTTPITAAHASLDKEDV